MRSPFLVLCVFLGTSAVAVADEKPKRLLLVTQSGSFMHDSIGVAEKVLKEIGPKHGFEVSCLAFTRDPDATVKVTRKMGDKKVEVEMTALAAYEQTYRERTGIVLAKDHVGRVNSDVLKKYDIVLFFTQGQGDLAPLTKDELVDLTAWVRNGGAFAGTHCASDSFYVSPYKELVGALFVNHPWTQKIKLHVEDPKHPAASGFMEGSEIDDEMYQFVSPYSRERLHVILSIDNSSIDLKKGQRADKDYAVSWCQKIGKGRSFYTSLGHRREVWKDARYQKHLIGGLRWAVGLEEGDATPTAKLKKD